MLVDYNTRLMTPLSDKVSYQTPFDVSISLSNDLTVIANKKGTCTATWNGKKKKTKVGLPETVLLELRNYSPLSTSTLVRKGIAVVFTSENEILKDIVDEYGIIVIAAQSNITSTTFRTLCSRVLRVTLMISPEY